MKKRHLLAIALFTILLCVPCVPSRATCSHEWSEWTVYSNATCGDAGGKSRYCSLCGEYEDETIPATGNHAWGEWETEIEPKCFEDGYEERECSVCYEEEKRTLSAYNSHDFTEWEIITDSNCLNDGKAWRWCKRCSEDEYKILPQDSSKHEWGSWYGQAATALKKGHKTRTCYICNKEQTVSIAKLKASVTLNKKTVKAKAGKSVKLKIKKKTYGDKVKKWKTSNKNVATVSNSGKVTGKKKGTAKIVLVMESGAKASCKVKIE